VTAAIIPPGERPAVAVLLAAIERWRAALPGTLVIAVDGPGASGKSTIAGRVTEATGAALVHTDDFFQWPTCRAGAIPTLATYYDWRRLRGEALEPLLAGATAAFRRFDWAAGSGLTGPVTVEPGGLIVLEGVFSAAPQLSDLVDRSVLVQTATAERLRRLRARVTPDEWDDKWLAAEQAYFGTLRPPASFSLVVPGADDLPSLIQLKGTA
jgi:uridine kinase